MVKAPICQAKPDSYFQPPDGGPWASRCSPTLFPQHWHSGTFTNLSLYWVRFRYAHLPRPCPPDTITCGAAPVTLEGPDWSFLNQNPDLGLRSAEAAAASGSRSLANLAFASVGVWKEGPALGPPDSLGRERKKEWEQDPPRHATPRGSHGAALFQGRLADTPAGRARGLGPSANPEARQVGRQAVSRSSRARAGSRAPSRASQASRS